MEKSKVIVTVSKERFLDLAMSLESKDMTYVVIDVTCPERSTMTIKKWDMTFKMTDK
jgi:hypothetical protein